MQEWIRGSATDTTELQKPLSEEQDEVMRKEVKHPTDSPKSLGTDIPETESTDESSLHILHMK